MSHELYGILYSYIYLFGIVILAEVIRKKNGLSSSFTRKVIHIGVGIWGLGALAFFNTLWAVFIPPASFIVINLISYKTQMFKSMEIDDKGNLGTVLYPLSICFLLLVFWPMGYRLVPFIGLLIMAFGDGLASIFGIKFGKHHYSFWAHKKSIEGSIAMLVGSLLAVMIVLISFGEMSSSEILLQAGITALIATMIEGISPGTLDNLTVPLFSGFAYWLIFLL